MVTDCSSFMPSPLLRLAWGSTARPPEISFSVYRVFILKLLYYNNFRCTLARFYGELTPRIRRERNIEHSTSNAEHRMKDSRLPPSLKPAIHAPWNRGKHLWR